LALEAARLGEARDDQELLHVAEKAAFEAKDLMTVLPGHAPWGAQADAAIARVSTAQGNVERAAAAGQEAIEALQEGMHEDMNLDVLLPAGRAILAGGPEDA